MVKVFVGGLDANTSSDSYVSSEDLQKLFSEFGSLINKAERVDGKPYGFVHMKTRDAADRACAKLHRTMFKEQRITVECSRSKPCKFYVGRLPPNTSNVELRGLFEDEGAEVLECDVMINKNFGFVHIETNSDKKIAETCINRLNGYEFKGSNITVQFSETLKKGEMDDREDFGGFGRGRGRVAPFYRERPSPYPTANMMGNHGGNGMMNNRGPMMNNSPMNRGGMMNNSPMMNNQMMNNSMMNNPSMINPMMMDGMGMGMGGRNNMMGLSQSKRMLSETWNGDREVSTSFPMIKTDIGKPRSEEKDLTANIKEFEGLISCASLDSLGQNLTDLVKSGRFVDTHIQCKGAAFKAHGVILSAKSHVFAEMLESSDMVQMMDFEPPVVNTLLQYMYTGRVNLKDTDVDQMPVLLAAADKYQISGAKDALIVALAKGLNKLSVVTTLQFAVNSDLPELKTFATKYLIGNARQIMEDPNVRNSLKMFPDVMFELVEALSK